MEATPHIDYKKYLQLIIKKRVLFGLVALSIMTLAVAFSFVLPNKYEAKSTVFIEQNVISDLIRGIAITPSMDSKIKVLQIAMLNRGMLLKVIDELDLDIHYNGKITTEELVTSLQKATQIKLDQHRGVFTITYAHASPRIAMDYVNSLVRNYIEENTSSKREESVDATHFLAAQIETFKTRLEGAQRAIDKFRQEKGAILILSEAALLQDIQRAEARLGELLKRRKVIEAQRNLLTKSQLYLDEGNIKSVALPAGSSQAELAQYEAQLAEARLRYSDQHPLVIRIRESIDKLKGQMASQGASPASGQASQARPIEQTPQYELISVELQSMDEEEQRLRVEIAEKRQTLREVPLVQSALKELERVKSKESLIYEELVSRYGKSEVSKQMELQDKSINFRIVEPAILPQIPVSPNRALIISLGIVAGFGVAFGLLFLQDYFDSTIKSLHQLKNLKLPILAVIPDMDSTARIARSKRSAIWFALGAGGYFMLILGILCHEALHLRYIETALQQVSANIHLESIRKLL